MVNGQLEVGRGAEPEGPAGHRLNLGVHPFECAVGDAQVDPGQDAVLVTAEEPGEVPQRLEAGVGGHPEPVLEESLGGIADSVAPEVPEILLEQVRFDDWEVLA